MARKCAHCRATFQTPLELEAHVLKAHGATFPCPFLGCGKSFATRPLKEEHFVDNHSGQGPPYNSLQQRPASNRQSFVPDDAPAQYQPTMNIAGYPASGPPGKMPPATSSPLVHPPKTSAHHASSPLDTSENSDPLECGLCERKFYQRLDLNKHFPTHFGETLFHKRKRCGAAFTTAQALTEHSRSRTECSRTMKKWRICTMCAQPFNTPAALNAHMQAEHEPTKHTTTYAITVNLPPRIQQQTQQKYPSKPADLMSGYRAPPVRQAPQQPKAPTNPRRPAQGPPNNTPSAVPPKVYPVQALLATRPAAARAPSHPMANPGRRAQAPPEQSAPPPTHHQSTGQTKQGASMPQTKPFEKSTLQPQEISTRVTDLKMPERPKYNAEGAVLYNKQVWTGIPFEQHDKLLDALYWRCHLSMADRKTNRVPAAFEDAPSSDGEDNSEFEVSPAPSTTVSKHRTVGLAAHKVIVDGGKLEIVVLSVLDFFTGEVLLNHLVLPDTDVENWRTRITGLKENTISDAIKVGHAVLNGWKSARQAVWLLIDCDTVVVGYGLRETMDALRMTHGCGVDAAILVQEAAGGTLSKKDMRLEDLSRDLLGHELKSDKNNGRDCLELAFAARELVIWSTKHQDKLAAWGKKKVAGAAKEREILKRVKEELSRKADPQQEFSAAN